MSENLGKIRYDVEVGTSGMLKAETAVDKSTTNIANDFKKVDTAAKNTNTQMTKATAGVKKGVQANLGQAGIQVQQFVGQLQGGQSAMVALAQQSADLGIVLGAPLIGVFVSLAAVLAGTLAPAIFGTVSNIEKLQKAVETTKAIMTVGAGGIIEYTDEMRRLGEVSENLAKIKIALAMTANAEAMKAAKKEASSLREELFEFQEYAEDAAKRLTGFAGNADAVLDIASAMRSFNKAASDEEKLNALDRAEKSILALSKDGVFPTKDLADYAEKFFTFSDGVRQAVANNKALSAETTDFTNKINDQSSAFSDNIKQLSLQNILLKQGERAAYSASLAADGFTQSQINAQLAIYDANQALEKDIEDKKEAAEQNEKYKKSIDGVNDSLDAFFDKEQRDDRKKSERETQTNITFAQSVVNQGKSPEQQMAEQYERLKQLRDTDLENAQLYQDAMTSLEQQAAQNREDLLGESYARIGQQAADSMADYLTGVETAEDATRMLASTIISEVIQSLVKMGISSVTQSMTTTAAATTGIAATTGAAVTSTGVMAGAQSTAMATVAGAVGTIAGGLATAWAPAAAFASLATLGTNAAPAIAGIYSTMAATLGAQLVGGIVSNGITAATGFNGTSGGREFGGPVSSGSMYRVGEKGKPEFYKDNLGNLSMIPGENGEVIPASKMGATQSSEYNVNFNMNEITDDSFRQMAIRNADMFIGIIRADKNNRGESY